MLVKEGLFRFLPKFLSIRDFWLRHVWRTNLVRRCSTEFFVRAPTHDPGPIFCESLESSTPASRCFILDGTASFLEYFFNMISPHVDCFSLVFIITKTYAALTVFPAHFYLGPVEFADACDSAKDAE